MFDFNILFAIIFIIISDENVNQVFSQIHVRVAYLFLLMLQLTSLKACFPIFENLGTRYSVWIPGLEMLTSKMDFRKNSTLRPWL
jgi:uncharacterized membrane protein (DUF441 family)